MRRYLCNVPYNSCSGSDCILTKGLSKKLKVHATTIEAFNCYCAYLKSQGYKQVGPREFQQDGGPILVLNKKCRFGGILRMGKNQDGNGSRYVPKTTGKRSACGCIL